MNRIIFLLLLSATYIGATETNVTLSKIRFIINDERIDWSIDEKIPNIQIEGASSPSYLSTFFRYKPGDIIPIKSLDREIKRSQLRLEDSRLFYSVKVANVPPRRFPDRRTVVIEVQDGFRFRFGGGDLYGQFGQVNVKGSGSSYLLTAGVNRFGIKYEDMTLPNKMFYGSSLEYNNSYYKDGVDNLKQDAKASLHLGRFLYPDFKLSLGSSFYYFKERHSGHKNATSIYSSINYQIFNELRDSILNKTYIDSKFELGIKESPNIIIFESILRNKLIFLNSTVLASQLAYGWMSDSSRIFTDFNLYDYDPRKSIRAGYKEADLTSREYLLNNLELRFLAPTLNFPPIFKIQLSAFIYSDIALIDSAIKDAYGVGARIFFDNPIFTGMTFSYGINRYRSGRFIFNMTMGF